MRKVSGFRSLPLLAACLLVACGQEASAPLEDFDFSGDAEEGEEFAGFDAARGKADGLSFGNDPLQFAAACEDGEALTIAAVGDVLLHGRLQKQALGHEEGFGSLWSGISDLLKAADVTYANLEGPTAAGTNSYGRDVADPGKVFDEVVYTSYPMFNYHPSLLDDLVASGVDVVSTANNHSLDRRALGADRTIDALKERGLPFTGTRRQGDTDSPWYTTTTQGGMTLAWLACTYGTNGIPDPHGQVLLCFQQADEVEAVVKELAAREDIDAVIVTPHWGQEYQANPESRQIDLAHRLLDAGATLILGSHPHVLQPWERYKTRDGREGFVIYSLGNFVSGQRHLPRRSTLLLYVGLHKDEAGQVRVSGARYVPLHMTTRGDGFMTLEAIDRAGGNGDSRTLTTDMFGHWNLHVAQEPLAVNPECDPAWVPPHPHDGWIGGACASEVVCGGVGCDASLPGGMCTTPCDRLCPDAVGREGTFCVADEAGTAGRCALQCEGDGDCRTGYGCQEAARFGDPGTVRRVCAPVMTVEQP